MGSDIIIRMNSWDEFFKSIEQKEYWKTLQEFLDYEYSHFEVYPPRELMFNAFKLTKLEDVKVVVIGQDPYHEPNQAMGLAFSVPDETKCPPSLVNIFKEIEFETGKITAKTGDLTYLAKQGVFLLNTVLSVRKGEAFSHKRKEYASLIKDVLLALDEQDQPIVFMLWGGPAGKFEKFITNPNHLVIKRTHPSPLGANQGGWFKCNQFNECNSFLKSKGLKPIEWVK